MGETPKFSVVIPAYNAADTVEDALLSVLSQSETSWEVLVVDDGSSDSTGAVLQRLQEKLPRLVVFRHPGGVNRGVAASRNLGVSRARGEMVVFLDADDVLRGDALATYRDGFACFPRVAMVYALAEGFGDARQGRLIGRGEPERPAGMLRQFARFNVAATSAVAVRRSAVGPEPFPVGLPFQFEDWACWLRVARRWPIVFVPRPVARYRVHAGSFLSEIGRRRLMAAYEAAQADFLRAELGEGDDHERRALADGLAFRGAAAVLQVTSAIRRGRPGDARRWFAAALRIAGGWRGLMAVLPFVLQERRRIGRGLDPPLSLDPPPELPEAGIHAG